jgi:hypothetical protein
MPERLLLKADTLRGRGGGTKWEDEDEEKEYG